MELKPTIRTRVLLALCASLLLGACSKPLPTGDSDDSRDPQAWEVGPVVMLYINTLTDGVQRSNVQEKIRSLRILMMHEAADGSRYLEANRLIEIPDNTDASLFRYFFQKQTVAGKKSFYLIANEESIAKVTLAGQSGFPDKVGSQQPTLTQFLNAFDPAMPTTGEQTDAAADQAAAAAGREFEELLGRLCFEPMMQSYDGVTEPTNIYLPYSAYYHTGFDVAPDAGREVDRTDRPMYLVPVATKFTFKFNNYRDGADVAIDYLALERTNKSNYLMAKFDETKQPEVRNGELFVKDPLTFEDLYWIDWLHNVAKATQAAPGGDDNYDKNFLYGWLTDFYQVPYPMLDKQNMGDAVIYDFVSGETRTDAPTEAVTAAKPWKLAQAGSGEDDFTTAEFGPFYLPEGHYQETATTTNSQGQAIETTGECYNLTIHMRDMDETSYVKTATTEISHLKALFRSTHVVITITLRQGGVRIYAQVWDWDPQSFYGYVQDEEDFNKK